jgi:hypothetical protein
MKEEKENIYININKQIIEKIYMANYLPTYVYVNAMHNENVRMT